MPTRNGLTQELKWYLFHRLPGLMQVMFTKSQLLSICTETAKGCARSPGGLAMQPVMADWPAPGKSTAGNFGEQEITATAWGTALWYQQCSVRLPQLVRPAKQACGTSSPPRAANDR
ncbi:MAG: hypothetical protein R3C56_35600 [Pirellulaceae bacterium]